MSGYNGGSYSNNGGYDGGRNDNSHNNNGGYQQSYSGEAGQYYGQGQPQDQQPYSGQQGYGQEPPQYQQYASTATHSSNSGRNSHNQGYQNQYNGEGDPEGERGIMGGIAGGAAGAYGGHALGGKAGHGTSGMIVGALAGAFAGHKTQDTVSDWKDERDDKKKQEHEQQHHQPEHRQDDKPRGGNFAGNFTASSNDIRLDAHGDYNLHAQCRRPDGSYQSSTIALNKYLENDNGSFHWSSGNRGGPSTTIVQQGDTLRAIAARHNCGFEQIAQHNGIQNADMIYPGQVLQVPGGGSGGGGNFSASAKDMRLVDGGQRLVGELQRDGRWVQASIVLDERIGNINGCLEFV